MMFEFNGNEYWDLNEVSQRLEISKEEVLKQRALAREALIKYKGEVVCENILIKDGEFKGEFEDYKDIEWIDGMFWLQAKAYVRLKKLFNEQKGLKRVLVKRLTPQNFIDQSLPPSKQRSLCASFDWFVVSDVMLAKKSIDKDVPIYFLPDTVKNFATKKRIKQSNTPNTGPISTTDELLQKRPSQKAIEAKSTPLFRQPYQESEILRVIQELGFEALALPKYIQKSKKHEGVNIKARVREVLNWQGTIFEKAWDRIRANKEIMDKDS